MLTFYLKIIIKLFLDIIPDLYPEDCPNIEIDHDFLYFDNESTISSLINEVCLHMTFNSQSAFDAAIT